MKVKLSVFQSNQKLSDITLGEDIISTVPGTYEYFIGRSKDCHVVLDSPLISRKHAKIVNHNDKWELINNSNFGFLIVNGQSVDRKILENGDLISIDPFLLSVIISDTSPAHSLNSQSDLLSKNISNTIKNTNKDLGPKEDPLSTPSNHPPLTTADVVDQNLHPSIVSDGEVDNNSNHYDSDYPENSSHPENSSQNSGAGSSEEGSSSEFVTSESQSDENNSEDIKTDMSDIANDNDNNDNNGNLDSLSNNELSPESGDETFGISDVANASNSSENLPISNDSEGTSNSSEENGDSENSKTEDSARDSNVDVNEDSGKTQIISNFAQYILKIFGEFAPYDKFELKDKETFIGRDPKKCQIILNDPEVSSVHAVLKKGLTGIVLEDLNSSNGTILNGSRINHSELSDSNEFIIGSTTFTLEIKSALLAAESERLMPVAENQEIEIHEEIEEEVPFEGIDGAGDGINEASTDSTSANVAGATTSPPKSKSILAELFSKDALKNPAKRKKLIIVVAVLVALVTLLTEDEPPKQPSSKDTTASNSNLLKKDGSTSEKKDDKDDISSKNNNKPKKKLTPEEKDFLEQTYVLARSLFEKGNYKEAEIELAKIFEISEDGYKEAIQLKKMVKEGLEQIAALKAQEQKMQEMADRKKKIEDLLKKANDAVEKKNVEWAETLFNQILSIDPEQADVNLLRMQLTSWKKEQERIKVEEEAKKADRKRKEDELTKGTYRYLKKKWFLAIDELEKFLRKKNMDEDLIKKATEMLEDSRNQLRNKIDPLLGKARSLKEGQDLKGAYENYLKILEIEPTNAEALNEINDIKENLDFKARKVYREALISESLSLFEDAKEKFMEVMQISPTDSQYYEKAKKKLKNYN